MVMRGRLGLERAAAEPMGVGRVLSEMVRALEIADCKKSSQGETICCWEEERKHDAETVMAKAKFTSMVKCEKATK